MADISWHVGDWVEVRSIDEILATLDAQGSLEALPFMPEMLAFCGRRFPVVKVAHKTCDPTGASDLRRMENTVHLETRCDGASHGGCQAGCLLFWKTAWLKRVDGPAAVSTNAVKPVIEMLERATQQPGSTADDIRYRCQATEIVRASTRLSSLEPWQYVRDVLTGNVTLKELFRYMPLEILKSTKLRLRAIIEHIKKTLRGNAPAAPSAKPAKKLPIPPLNLQPGELVRVKPREEIEATLNKDSRNLGLSFDPDMRQFCGTERKVLWRMERLIDEKTGKMIKISRDCIVLQDVICTGLDCRNRLFCPRSVFTYWREAWLTRAGDTK
jgi:hypothetical protein